ncbi:Uroporphyrinogen III synthase HEM4 (Modular protein) (modular protein) [Rhodospirillaceae bacterium LM-1]|nr:Uroporphyrinogen III synthase HEM4 (Modular protein) (modular protein) [Rhodospirillaceae bacterium LM-1]
MRLLVTRPAQDAAPLAKLLEERGHQAVLEPLLEIVPLQDASIDLAGVQALLFTSANGVRAFASLHADRGLAVFAVGASTASAASNAGFERVESADGDVDDLARLVRLQCDPAKGALLHPAASHVAGDLAGLLGDAGFEVRRRVIYESKAAKALSSETIRLLQEGAIDGALFFSPRTAESFASLAGQANIADRLGDVTAFALSQAVASRLQKLPFKAVRIAESPDQNALLTCIDEGAMNSEVEHKEPQDLSAARIDEVMPPPVLKAKSALPVFLAGGVLGIALVAGAGAMLWPMLVDSLKTEIMQEEVDAEPALTAGSDAIKALSARDESLARRISDLEGKAAQPAHESPGLAPEELTRLNERFAKLETDLQTLSSRREAGPSMLVAALLLRDANNAGRSFGKELETLARLAGDDVEMAPHLSALKPIQEKGVAPIAEIERGFQTLKPELLRSTMDANEDLWASVLRRLSVLISIRRVDSQGQDEGGIDGAVARAEASLAKRDLAGAAANLTTLAGPVGDLVKPWLGEAYTHIEADMHIQALLDRALALTVKP